jgi:hypothetical protein
MKTEEDEAFEELERRQFRLFQEEAKKSDGLNREPFAYVMVFENGVKHCVTPDTKGAVPVYTRDET